MFNHIAVLLDGSKLAESAIEPALEMAQKFESKVTFLSVAVTPLMQAAYAISGLPDADNLYLSLKQAAYNGMQTYLDGLVEQWSKSPVDINVSLTIGTPIADTILTTADLLDVDLIMMSSHGRSGVRRWLLGSVAEQVIRKATIPVFVFHPEVEKANYISAELVDG